MGIKKASNWPYEDVVLYCCVQLSRSNGVQWILYVVSVASSFAFNLLYRVCQSEPNCIILS